MRIIRLVMIAAALVAGFGCSNLDLRSETSPTQTIPIERQILVMLKESPVRHYRPGTNPLHAYGSGSAPASILKTAQDLAREYDFKLASDWPMPALGVRCFLAEVATEHLSRDIVARLAADPRVESVQPVQIFRGMGRGHPDYKLQTSAKVLRLDELHRIATGMNIKVAQIDTGVELHHPSLEGRLSDAKNFVDGSDYLAELHGTAVAGIIAAKADSGIGIVGVAPDATLLPLRACWQRTEEAQDAICTSFTLAKAIQYAMSRQARVINLSLAGPRDPLLERLIDKAFAQGITVIGAMDPVAPDDSFPAIHPNVIAVASIGSPTLHHRAILAPGDDVLTTMPNASWGFVSGSSFATAQVTGIVALLLQKSPRLKPGEISALLRENGRQTSDPGGATELDACAALASLSVSQDGPCGGAIAKRRARQQGGHPPS